MYNAGRSTKNYKQDSEDKRISFLIAGIFVLIIIYTCQFFSKSILDHASCIAQAQDQYIVEEELPSTRGLIYASDKYNTNNYFPIALNEDTYQVSVVPKNVKDKDKLAQTLADILKIDKKEIFDQINNDKPYIPPIAKKQSKETANAVLDADLIGVIVKAEQSRIYPEDNLVSKITGFVDAGMTGRYGIEGYYNKELTGIGGEITAEKDILGRLISVGNKTEAQNGADLYLTIDRNIQYTAVEYLKKAIDEMQAERGSITIVEPKTGRVIAMASIPDYDPNTYYKTAQEHDDYFTNTVVSNVWEPGSIMKPIVMSMAMDQGKIEPDTTDDFGGSVTIQGFTIKNAMNRTFGKETMTKVLENSDNIAMTWVADKMSDEEMYNYFTNYGFGNITNIDLEGDTSGYLLPLDNWNKISHATMSFGQGISATPLQMVTAYAAIANGGKMMKPYVVDKIIKADGEQLVNEPSEVKQVIKPETAKKVTDMLVSVVDNGYDLQGKVNGYKIAGKTGTAQIADDKGGYDENNYIHSFAGYFPADDPKYAMLIVLEKPKKYNFASSTCAPYFSKLAQWLLNYSETKPTI